VAHKRLALDSRALLREQGRGDRRAQITLAQLLRMTDGLEFNEQYDDPLSDVVIMLLGTGDASGFALHKPLASKPGTRYRYASGTTNVLASVLRRTLDDRDLSAVLRRRLLGRLWHAPRRRGADATGTPVLSSFMHATAREWATFGQFLLQDGVAWRAPPAGVGRLRARPHHNPSVETRRASLVESPGGVRRSADAAAALPQTPSTSRTRGAGGQRLAEPSWWWCAWACRASLTPGITLSSSPAC
jgi:CubicO group peptidase (beta-lactamase class C family)